jgi:exodeoxyribonuclease VII small subunit
VAKATNPTDDGTTPEFPDVPELSYEQARDELIGIVSQLEAGSTGLEESMRLWRRGEALAAHCSTWLDGAEAALSTDDGD